MLKHLCSIDKKFEPLRALLLKHVSPLVDLAIRLVIANIFFQSGWLKFQDFSNGTFDRQVALFKDTYNLPILPPVLGAYGSMGGELLFSVLLALGLATRFAALALMVITGLAVYVFPDVFEHYLWALLLATLLARGGGVFSLDHLLCRGK